MNHDKVLNSDTVFLMPFLEHTLRGLKEHALEAQQQAEKDEDLLLSKSKQVLLPTASM